MDKKGLSGVIVTLLIIVISVILIFAVGIIINNFVTKGSADISLTKYTIDMKIKTASLNYDNSTATVRVKRELGSGNLVGLKFIFEDDKSSDLFERRFTNFQELEEKTFYINVTGENSGLNLYKISKVSIAPIIVLESGKEVIGRVSDSYGGLDRGLGDVTQEEPEPEICQSNLDCGTDYFMNGTEYCDEQANVYQYKKTFSCTLGFCYNQVSAVLIKDCPELCYDGNCIEQVISCSPANVSQDCGIDGFFGPKGCGQGDTTVVQDYKDFECINSSCSVVITSEVLEYCNETEVCFRGECFVPLECTKNSDCSPGKICVNGSCVDEIPLTSGAIYSIWPFGIGEYFDSSDLPNPTNVSYVGKYVVFPSSLQEGCLKITEHKKPNKTISYAYVRLNETITNISNGDSFAVLETTYFCGLM
jgi:hypothetical protein